MGIEPETNDTLVEEQLPHRFEIFRYKFKQKTEVQPLFEGFSL